MEKKESNSQEQVIGLQNQKIRCTIGVHPEERQREQQVFIDLSVGVNLFQQCAAKDCLESTIDHMALAQTCLNVAKKGRYLLLETLAWNLTETLLREFPILWASVKIRKPEPSFNLGNPGNPDNPGNSEIWVDFTTVELKRFATQGQQ